MFSILYVCNVFLCHLSHVTVTSRKWPSFNIHVIECRKNLASISWISEWRGDKSSLGITFHWRRLESGQEWWGRMETFSWRIFKSLWSLTALNSNGPFTCFKHYCIRSWMDRSIVSRTTLYVNPGLDKSQVPRCYGTVYKWRLVVYFGNTGVYLLISGLYQSEVSDGFYARFQVNLIPKIQLHHLKWANQPGLELGCFKTNDNQLAYGIHEHLILFCACLKVCLQF